MPIGGSDPLPLDGFIQCLSSTLFAACAQRTHIVHLHIPDRQAMRKL
jgi:hypothetical protein